MEREPAVPRGYHPRRRGHPRIPPGTDHATWSVLLWQTRKAAVRLGNRLAGVGRRCGAEQGYLRAGDRICCVYVAGAMVNTCPPGIMK